MKKYLMNAILLLTGFIWYQGLQAQNDPGKLFDDQFGLLKTNPDNQLSNLNPATMLDANDHLDSLDWSGWNTDINEWQLNSRDIYEADDQGRPAFDRILSYNGSVWSKEAVKSYTYDDNGNLIHVLAQSWDGSSWVNVYQYVYTIDDHNDPIVLLDQLWDGTNWNNYTQNENTFDNNHNYMTQISSRWENDAWAPKTYSEFVYEGNNLLDSSLLKTWDPIGEYWENYTLTTYQYTPSNKTENKLVQVWNEDQWDNQQNYSWTFDANDLPDYYLRQKFVSGAWVNGTQTFFEHDSYGNEVYEYSQNYVGGVWEDYYRTYLNYDDNQNLDVELLQTFDQVWINSDSFKYYYTLISKVKPVSQDNSLAFITNPVSDFLQISFQSGTTSEGFWSIYSTAGVHLFSGKFDSQISRIDVSQLPPGSYWLRIRQDDIWQTSLFIKS